MYTITLADGTKLKNLELNGNNFIAEGVFEDSVFEGNLDTVTITDGETTETFTGMRLMSNIVRDERSWFVLGEKTAQQLRDSERDERIAQLESELVAANAKNAALVESQQFLEDCLAEMAGVVYA